MLAAVGCCIPEMRLNERRMPNGYKLHSWNIHNLQHAVRRRGRGGRKKRNEIVRKKEKALNMHVKFNAKTSYIGFIKLTGLLS
jgi:hypothetical protein